MPNYVAKNRTSWPRLPKKQPSPVPYGPPTAIEHASSEFFRAGMAAFLEGARRAEQRAVWLWGSKWPDEIAALKVRLPEGFEVNRCLTPR